MNDERHDADTEPQDLLLAILSDERAFHSDPTRIARAVEGVERRREWQVARWIAAAAVLIAAVGLLTIDHEDPPPNQPLDQIAAESSKTDWLFQLPDAAFRGPGEPVAMHDATFEVAVLSARETPRLVLMEKQVLVETEVLMETPPNGDDR